MKPSKHIKAIAIAAGAASVLAVFGIVLAQEYSADDPLISKSYLDNVFYSLVTQYTDTKLEQTAKQLEDTNKKLEETSKKLDDTNAKLEEIQNNVSSEEQVPAATAQNTEYQVITLEKGQTLYAKASLEFILRPGASAIAVSPSVENGIANVSHGTELMNEHPVPINAYCVIPRGDGRGIQCLSDTAYIMVRGQYEIK